MSGPLGGDTIVIVNAELTSDARYQTKSRDWPNAVRTTVTGCNVQPISAAEDTADREYVKTRLALFVPGTGAGLTAVSRVEHDGITYEVDGEPGRFRDLSGAAHHVEAVLKRLAG